MKSHQGIYNVNMKLLMKMCLIAFVCPLSVSLVTTQNEVKHGNIYQHQDQFLSKLKEKSAAALMSILLRWSLISTCL